MRRREAEFAGSHYPAGEQEFTRVMEHLLIDHWNPYEAKLRVQGCLVPDDTLLFSGECTVRTLARIEVPDRILLIHGRRHSPLQGVRLAAVERWETPFGDVLSDSALIAAMASSDPRLILCEACEEGESSVEAVLPILSFFNPDLRVAVLSVGSDATSALQLAPELVSALEAQDEGSILICAATTSHSGDGRYDVESLDAGLLDALEAFDTRALLAKEGEALAGCSVLALTTALCSGLGCAEFGLLDQRDSSDAAGSDDQIEGYIGGFFR